MAKVYPKTLSFAPSGSPDVLGYKLYWASDPTPVDYASNNVDLGNSTSVNLISIPALAGLDGIYNLGVVAYDDVGNESDMSVSNSVPLDFVPPDPPGALSIT